MGGMERSRCDEDITAKQLENYSVFSFTLTFKKLLQYLLHRIFTAHAWSIKCRQKDKLITQFGGKLRDERFEPNQFEHYLPNKNERATVIQNPNSYN